MCGIIGYTGIRDAVSKITKGLEVLEYRGYDSVGVAASTENGVAVQKCKGRIKGLQKQLMDVPIASTCAIGHTRWATHGGPSNVNAHPHRAGQVVLVHNGIIENYAALRENALLKDAVFASETDTEVAAALLSACYEQSRDPSQAILHATSLMRGSYAFGILFDDRAGEVWAVREGSPLILARANDGTYLASDITALLPFTKEYYCLEEGQIACLTPEGAQLFSEGCAFRPPEWSITQLTPEAAQKGGFSHFMLKEIYEQPEAIVKSVSCRINGEGLPDFSADGIDVGFWNGIRQIQIVACGSAMHAGLVGGRLLEDIAGIPTSCYVASEYRYHPPVAADGTLAVIISQSGETADSLAALRYARSAGLPTLAIVNAVATTIAREAERCIYTYAGPEIAVATTKGYCTQVSVLYLMAAAIAHARGRIDAKKARELARSIAEDAPRAVEHMLGRREELCRIAAKLTAREHIFYIGRGIDHALSQEGALKLKEISYLHCEAYAAGELKHGTISLIEEGTPVIAISTEAALRDKTESNVREVRSRGAYVILLCREGNGGGADTADEVLSVPCASDAEVLFGAMAAIQLLAYEVADQMGRDVDRPRNLAKSVTVE